MWRNLSVECGDFAPLSLDAGLCFLQATPELNKCFITSSLNIVFFGYIKTSCWVIESPFRIKLSVPELRRPSLELLIVRNAWLSSFIFLSQFAIYVSSALARCCLARQVFFASSEARQAPSDWPNCVASVRSLCWVGPSFRWHPLVQLESTKSASWHKEVFPFTCLHLILPPRLLHSPLTCSVLDSDP